MTELNFNFDQLFERKTSDDLAKAAFLVHQLPRIARKTSKAGVTWAIVGTAIILGLDVSNDDICYLNEFVQLANDLGFQAQKEDIAYLDSLTVKDLMKIDREGTSNLMRNAGISDRDYGPYI